MLHWGMLHRTITLIGMPGAGKSTIGVLLAKHVGLNFVDTDLLIQVREDHTLQEILDTRGYLELRHIEEQVLLDMPLDATLVATGGSAVYSKAGMARLGAAGPVVYLSAARPVLEQRISAHLARGIAAPPEHTFADVFAERVPLYEQAADLTIAADQGSAEETAAAIATALAGLSPAGQG